MRELVRREKDMDAMKLYPPAAKTARTPGLRYEICAGCGTEWNVSRGAPLGWYICPWCRGEYRNGKKTGRKDAG